MTTESLNSLRSNYVSKSGVAPGVIEETIQIHDKKQFEIKLGYHFAGKETATVYDVDTYLFFPNNLGINRYTYTREDFYSNTQVYVRLKTPEVLLQKMVREKDSPLEKLRKGIENLLANGDDKSFESYEYHLKMFCCIFKSAIREHIRCISQKEHNQDVKDLIEKYLRGIETTTLGFRGLRSLLNIPSRNKTVFSIFLFGDEYLSLLIEFYTHELLQVINTLDFSGKEELTSRLFKLIRKELDYRQENDYPSIPCIDSTNEEFLFRSSVLKKFMGNVLFLQTQFKHEGEFLEQITFALAAGIAMMFATGAAFLAQSTYSTVSMPLFFVLVVSYMFKDRVKDFIRIYLGTKLKNWLFDHRRKVYFNTKNNLGWCKESFTFLKTDKIPDTILKLRARDHITEIENDWVGEKIILYRKQIKLFNQQFRSVSHGYPLDSINDIMRINISRFLRKMDNPKKPIYVGDGINYRKIYGNRVYHVNMIMKYSEGKRVKYKRFRLVLCQSGIKRIEAVAIGTE